MKRLLNIQLEDNEFDRLMCEQSKGKELFVEKGVVVAREHTPTQKEINNARIVKLKQELAKAKEDVEQVELFGMERLDYETKKARCVEIITELRTLEKSVDTIG